MYCGNSISLFPGISPLPNIAMLLLHLSVGKEHCMIRSLRKTYNDPARINLLPSRRERVCQSRIELREQVSVNCHTPDVSLNAQNHQEAEVLPSIDRHSKPSAFRTVLKFCFDAVPGKLPGVRSRVRIRWCDQQCRDTAGRYGFPKREVRSNTDRNHRTRAEENGNLIERYVHFVFSFGRGQTGKEARPAPLRGEC